ncbi:inositol monophosphatase family protein [Allohahella marinimesophila]|uniref:Inositol monophosphatase family protein n=1 Tax=Allohahella marinimesophila TaxID=1054972 RepID=A0ABP7P4V1_9GAMM
MQPAVNIVVRTLRNTREHLIDLVNRESLTFSDQQEVSELIRRVNESFHQDVSRAIERAYPRHTVIAAGGSASDSKLGSAGKAGKFGKAKDASKDERKPNEAEQLAALTWELMPVHNPISMVRGWSDWGLSLVAKRGDDIEHAIYFEPITGVEYTASRGKSASKDDRRIRISPQVDLSLSLLTGNPVDNITVEKSEADGDNAGEAEKQDYTSNLKALTTLAFGFRPGFNAPLALLQAASNQVDAAVLSRVDMSECAAAAFIAQEAGALLTRFDGTPINSRTNPRSTAGSAAKATLICANAKLTKTLLGQLNSSQR